MQSIPWIELLALVPIGFAVGTLGTLIGAGGGFVLMPFLLLAYPAEPSASLAAVSLAVVLLNALSGSIAYSLARRIDYRSAAVFAAATMPGAVLGALTVSRISRRLFDLVFGVLLVASAVFLALKPRPRASPTRQPGGGWVSRTLIDRSGAIHEYSFPLLPGILLSLAVGFVSSLLGIGGGIIHVPVLVSLLGFPVHIATATSHLVLAVTSLAGTATYALSGALLPGLSRAAALGVGVLGGAQLGAFFSTRVRGVWILRALAAALGLVGIRIFLAGLLRPN